MSGDAASGTDGTFDGLRRRLVRTYEMLRGSNLDVRPFRPGEDGPLAAFEPPSGHEELDRYWVNAPFAYVVITHDLEESKNCYHAVEPDLNPFEETLRDRVLSDTLISISRNINFPYSPSVFQDGREVCASVPSTT